MRARPWLLVAGVLLLFTVWSQSFISIETLLRPGTGPARFGWLALASARFVLAAVLCGGWLLAFRRREALAVAKAHWRRLLLCGLFAVPGYNCALCAGQSREVAAPIASLLTTLAPLFVMLLSAAFLGERITARRAFGLALALAGLLLVARSKEGGTAAYPREIALTALAPLCWSIHTVLTKPLAGRVSPLLWTYLVIAAGTVPMAVVFPFAGGPEVLRLDGAGWAGLLHLSVLCTVLGFALWTWLLRHLPATSVGFTIFLNPPMTTVQKRLLAALFPAAFAYTIATGEAVGGILMLTGVAVATLRRRRPPHIPEKR